MKAAVYYEGGGPEVLQYEEVPDPNVPPRNVLIEVQAVSIEGGDVLARGYPRFVFVAGCSVRKAVNQV